MSESTFQSQVTRWMRDTGWYVYFTPDSRRSPSGYPDLTATKDGYLLFNELKRGPKDGPRESQIPVLWELLKVATGGEIWTSPFDKSLVRVDLWRPEDEEYILRTLENPAQTHEEYWYQRLPKLRMMLYEFKRFNNDNNESLYP